MRELLIKHQKLLEALLIKENFTLLEVYNLVRDRYTFNGAEKLIRNLTVKGIVIKTKQRTTGNRYTQNGQGWNTYKVSHIAKIILENQGTISLKSMGRIYLDDWKGEDALQSASSDFNNI